VIDRLRKNRNQLEKRNNLRSSSPHLVAGRRPENRAKPRRSRANLRPPSAAILRLEISGTREPWLFRSLVFGSGIRRLDGEAVGGGPCRRAMMVRRLVCPALDYSVPPASGWVMTDCRMWTNLVPNTTRFSLAAYGWGYR